MAPRFSIITRYFPSVCECRTTRNKGSRATIGHSLLARQSWRALQQLPRLGWALAASSCVSLLGLFVLFCEAVSLGGAGWLSV